MVPGRAAPRWLQPPVPTQLYRAPSRRGPAAPPGLFPAHPLGPGAAGTGGNCGFGVNSVPLRAAGARREGNTAPGQQRAASARLAAPSLWPLWDRRWGSGGRFLAALPSPCWGCPSPRCWAPSGLADMLGAFPDKIHKGFSTRGDFCLGTTRAPSAAAARGQRGRSPRQAPGGEGRQTPAAVPCHILSSTS